MTKADRQKVFDKYGGRCAYCGCELQKGWHVDEIEPVRRNYKDDDGYWMHVATKRRLPREEWIRMSEDQLDGHKWVAPKKVFVGYVHPERMHIDNQNPACASCNINKHSEPLESFRKAIAGYMNHLNNISTQYKIAKRYGLIQETGIEVKFYFETINNQP